MTPASASLKNIFDDLPALKPPETKELEDELARYLSTLQDLNVKDGLRWWYDRKHLYPCLHRMAMDYLSIPGNFFFFVFAINYLLIHICLTATSVDVEQIFSQGRLLLSHVHSRLSVMSSHMFCTRSHLFSHFSAFGLNLSHVTTTNTASLVMCGPVYSHYTHQQSRGCHASHARSHPATYIIIHSLSSTTLLFTII